VTFPVSKILLAIDSDLVSQKRTVLSKWPLTMVDPILSEVTRSLQIDPANFVSTPETTLLSFLVLCVNKGKNLV